MENSLIKKLIIEREKFKDKYEQIYAIEDERIPLINEYLMINVTNPKGRERGLELQDEIRKLSIPKRKIIEEIEKECSHPIFLVTYIAGGWPNLETNYWYKCMHCGKEFRQNTYPLGRADAPLLFSPKNPYVNYNGRAVSFFPAIQDEYFGVLDLLYEQEKYDLTAEELDDILDERLTERFKKPETLGQAMTKRNTK